MTLRELMNQIERTNGKKLPTAAWLRMGNSPLTVEKRISENCCLSVYQNGFALYQTPDGCTVFRVDYCGGYTYFGREQETCFSEDYFAGEEWWVRLVMEGEDRLTHNRNVQIERYECSFGADSAELGDTTVPVFSVQKDLLVREALENDEDGLHEQSGISDPEYSNGRAAETADGQIRADAESISEGESQRSVPGDAPEWEAHSAPDGDRPDSGREDGAADREHGESGGRERSAESGKPDAVAAEDEQHSEPGRGNGSERDRLQLNTPPDNPELSEILAEKEIPLPVVDEVIRMGSNQSKSVLRVAAHFMLDAGDDAQFLKNEYRHGAKGIVENGTSYSVWFDENGMRFAKGKSAELSNDAAVLTWEQVAQRTKELLYSGSYAPQIILNQAIPNERLEVAQKLWYLHQDCNGEYFLDEELFRGGFPDSTERIAELLEDRGFVSDTLQGLGDFVMRYEEDRSILRFHFHRPEELLRRLAELENRQVHLPVSTAERFRDNVDFITEDEIDHYFMGGGPYSDGVLSTYSFFIHDHTSAEKAQFLKERYGIGGSSHALCGADNSHADYNGKGIMLARGNYGDKDAPSVLLKWPQSADRVEKLILTGRYLKEKDYLRMPGFERHALAQRLNSFYYRQDRTALDLPEDVDMFSVCEALEKKMENTDWLENVVADMSSIIGGLHETDERYEQMQSLFADVVAYKNGTFSLFTPSKSVLLEAQKYGTDLMLPLQDENAPELVAVYGYAISDTVYVDGTEYLVDEIESGTIVLRDKMLPLFTYAYEKAALDDLVRGNPLNDHLIIEYVEQIIEQQAVIEDTEQSEVVQEAEEAEQPPLEANQGEQQMEMSDLAKEQETDEADTPAEQPAVLDASRESEYDRIREKYKVGAVPPAR